MECMKGEAKPILFYDHAAVRVQLVSYPDESWGIVRNGRTLCTWETDELTDCLRTFLMMAGRTRGALLGRPRLQGTTSDKLVAWSRAEFN